MNDFDRSNNTLIDYFLILGPSQSTLAKLIKELSSGCHIKNQREYDRISDPDGDDNEPIAADGYDDDHHVN